MRRVYSPEDVIALACNALAKGQSNEADAILSERYPFEPLSNVGRHYSEVQLVQVFARDGFIDRYSGRRLVFPGTLRLLSKLLPNTFPFHTNWKTDACHFAYYELFPTIDHLVPVSRGGLDTSDNWITTSMLRNSAKANFTLEELGWRLHPQGNLDAWDGLTGWFLQWRESDHIAADAYLRRWRAAALAIPQFRAV